MKNYFYIIYKRSIISIFTLVLCSQIFVYSEHEQNKDNILAESKQLTQEIHNSYGKLSTTIEERILLIYNMISSFIASPAMVDSLEPLQLTQISTFLERFLQNPISKELSPLYLSSFNFIAKWLASPEKDLQNSAKNVFYEILLTCQSLSQKSHLTEILNYAHDLHQNLHNIQNMTQEQKLWLASIEAILGQFYNGESTLSVQTRNAIITSIIKNILSVPGAGHCIQQDIYSSLYFISCTLNVRDESIKAAAHNLLNTVWGVIIGHKGRTPLKENEASLPRNRTHNIPRQPSRRS